MCQSTFFTEQYNPSSVHLKLPHVSKLTLKAWENTGCHLIKNARVLPCLPCSTYPGRNSNPVKSFLCLLDKKHKMFPLPAGPWSSEQKGELLCNWRKQSKPVQHTAVKLSSCILEVNENNYHNIILLPRAEISLKGKNKQTTPKRVNMYLYNT